MSALLYQIFTSSTLISLSLYHLTTTIHNHLKSPTTFSSKPYHPLPLPSSSHLRHLPLYLTAASLLISTLYHLLSASTPDPLLIIHHFTSLSSASISFLFFLISLSLLLPLLPLLPHDVSFAFSSAAFYLLSSTDSSRASVIDSALESHLLTLSSRASLISSLLLLSLAVSPKLFISDVSLCATVLLQGLWALQTGLSLHVDAFIPEGCHKLLDVVGGVQGSTKCEIDESKMRAVAILDLMFVVYVVFVVVIVFAVYGIVSKVTGISIRRFGSYEALPNVVVDGTHVQLKTLSGTQA